MLSTTSIITIHMHVELVADANAILERSYVTLRDCTVQSRKAVIVYS